MCCLIFNEGGNIMKYQRPVVLIYDEEVMQEIRALAASNTCNCSASGSKVCYQPKY